MTPQFLMEGAHHSLEQCGLLLHDAVALFRIESFASATVLAALAREELGKAIELRAMRREAMAGEVLTVKHYKCRCGGNHIAKQDRGQTSTVLRDYPLDFSHMGKDPQSEEYALGEAKLQGFVVERRSQVPTERHLARMSCLYVDPDSAGARWNTPKTQTREDANLFLVDAANDYSVQYSHYQGGNASNDGKELYEALQNWAGRTELPKPEWP